MFQRFIKLYTPFICSIVAAIHGVLFLLEKGNSNILLFFGDITGNSILLLYFVLIHSKRMCKWYKMSIYLLMVVHFLNLLYYAIGEIPAWIVLYCGLILNIASVMCWLIFRVTYKTSKVIHSACKHSEIE